MVMMNISHLLIITINNSYHLSPQLMVKDDHEVLHPYLLWLPFHCIKHTLADMIYIKTQVFRLLRYYSAAPRNIARSDWVTQNITHNMTSSLL